MIRALLFDMGGTLDGDGVHWLDRFELAYAAVGVAMPRESLKAAFDAAERRAAVDEEIERAGLDAMVDRHVSWQLERLARNSAVADFLPRPETAEWSRLERAVVRRFVDPIRRLARTNARVLADLHARGLLLGVVSNGCGNVQVLCDDLGYAPFLSLVVDSRRVGLQKPDPAIYRHAAARLGLQPAAIMMVGDSIDRDMRPAAAVGMRTAWVRGTSGRRCPDPTVIDVCLSALTELPEALDRRAQTVA
jgi:putative hydrolase of the HAD superfamily